VKVLGLSCSPRKGSNTEILVGEALAGAKEAGADVEIVTVVGKDIKPCDACETCFKTGKCHIKDDMQDIYPKLSEADGIIFGSPSYNRNVTAQATAIMNRCYFVSLQDKVGAPIVVCAKTGGWNVAATLYLFFVAKHMAYTDYAMGLALDKGGVRKDEFAMKWAWELGKQVVTVANQGFKWPEEYKGALYSYVANKYGMKITPYE